MPGLHQVPEGGGEQSKMEETDCEVICGAPTAFAVTGEAKVKVTSKLVAVRPQQCCSCRSRIEAAIAADGVAG